MCFSLCSLGSGKRGGETAWCSCGLWASFYFLPYMPQRVTDPARYLLMLPVPYRPRRRASFIRMDGCPFLGTWESLQGFPGSYFKCLLSTSPTVYWEFWPKKRQMPSVDICWVGLVWVKAISTAESSKQTQISRPAMRMQINTAGILGLMNTKCSSRGPRGLEGSSVCGFLMTPVSSPHKCFCTYINTQKI